MGEFFTMCEMGGKDVCCCDMCRAAGFYDVNGIVGWCCRKTFNHFADCFLCKTLILRLSMVLMLQSVFLTRRRAFLRLFLGGFYRHKMIYVKKC